MWRKQAAEQCFALFYAFAYIHPYDIFLSHVLNCCVGVLITVMICISVTHLQGEKRLMVRKAHAVIKTT